MKINSKFLGRTINIFGIICFVLNSLGNPSAVMAQTLNISEQGIFGLSESYRPAVISGMSIYPNNPLKFDFFIDKGDSRIDGEELKNEAQKMINYFMATLTVPDKDMWVNLSPYEKDRIIADGLGRTEMGRDMLVQDYFLKQLTASLMHPDGEVGKKFWEKIYAASEGALSDQDNSVDTFNKVWIVPQDASVYVHDNHVFVVNSHLKVMLEEDYLALEMNQGRTDHGLGEVNKDQLHPISETAKEKLREVVLPAIEKEVNEGKAFANLRQIYNSMILATWYKKNLRQSLLASAYLNQNKINGIDLSEEGVKERIYQQYVEAFKTGAYNVIKEEYDPKTSQIIPKRYFSGGLMRAGHVDEAALVVQPAVDVMVSVEGRPETQNFAMLSKYEENFIEKMFWQQIVSGKAVKGTLNGVTLYVLPGMTEEGLTLQYEVLSGNATDQAKRQQPADLNTLDHLIQWMLGQRFHDNYKHQLVKAEFQGVTFYSREGVNKIDLETQYHVLANDDEAQRYARDSQAIKLEMNYQELFDLIKRKGGLEADKTSNQVRLELDEYGELEGSGVISKNILVLTLEGENFKVESKQEIISSGRVIENIVVFKRDGVELTQSETTPGQSPQVQTFEIQTARQPLRGASFNKYYVTREVYDFLKVHGAEEIFSVSYNFGPGVYMKFIDDGRVIPEDWQQGLMGENLTNIVGIMQASQENWIVPPAVARQLIQTHGKDNEYVKRLIESGCITRKTEKLVELSQASDEYKIATAKEWLKQESINRLETIGDQEIFGPIVVRGDLVLVTMNLHRRTMYSFTDMIAPGVFLVDILNGITINLYGGSSIFEGSDKLRTLPLSQLNWQDHIISVVQNETTYSWNVENPNKPVNLLNEKHYYPLLEVGTGLILGVDQAMFATEKNSNSVVAEAVANPGGIDLSAKNLDLKEHGDRFIFDFSSSEVDPAQLENINGIQPVIKDVISITPNVLSQLIGQTFLEPKNASVR